MSLFSLLALLWASYSFQATIVGAIGVGLIACAVVAVVLPAFMRVAFAVLGLTIVLCSAALQIGQLRGVHQAEMLATKLAEAAEAKRADLAEKTRDAIASQAAADNAVLAEKNATLEKLLNDQPKDPAADRECVDRSLARRLRKL